MEGGLEQGDGAHIHDQSVTCSLCFSSFCLKMGRLVTCHAWSCHHYYLYVSEEKTARTPSPWELRGEGWEGELVWRWREMLPGRGREALYPTARLVISVRGPNSLLCRLTPTHSWRRPPLEPYPTTSAAYAGMGLALLTGLYYVV